MKECELSILIPARQEQFLAKTIEDIIEHSEADTEIIVVLDGAWADPVIKQHPMVNVIYLPESIGQRAATNMACRLARGKYVAKVDAHCSFDQGFDRKMIDGFKATGDNVVAVPIMRNLWAFDWKCMTKGTMVVTPTGLRPAEEIEEGDYIVSGDGKSHKVLSKITNLSEKNVVRIKPNHLPAIEITGDHLVKAYPYEHEKTITPNSHTMVVSEKEEWVEAGKLKDGLYKIIYPFSNEEIDSKLLEGRENKEDLARFLGYFMAEGNFYHKSEQGEYFKMTLCFNQDEDYIVDDIDKIIGSNFKNRYGKPVKVSRFKKTDPRTGWKYMRVNIYSQEATRFFGKFVIGSNSKDKQFVPEVLSWPKYLQKELFKGMLEGDGWVGLNRENLVTSYATSSKQLSHQVFNLMLRLGYRPGITERINKTVFAGKTTHNPAYIIRSYSDKDLHNCKGHIRGNEYLVSIHSVKNVEYDGEVYDLEIEGLPEILTEGGVIHNCNSCGWKKYQGPTPDKCESCGGKNVKKKMMWVGKEKPQSVSFCFDSEPHFQYFNEWKQTDTYKEQEKTGFTETMSLQGSFFMCTKEKYWELLSEDFGSWGNQGLQVACAFWLTGGRVVCNHNTWYAHMFRTQGGDFSFPYPQSENEIRKTKKRIRNQIYSNKMPNQVHPISWLVDKFWPVKGWTEENLEKLKNGTL